MNRPQDYIAVFDSGVGGISVLCRLRQQMPGENFLYYGDCAHAPYGTRPTEEVRVLALQAAEHLVEKGIKALVVACNTATAAAIEALRRKYPELIVVGIEPAVKPAAEQFPGGTVGVLATPVTLREEKFRALASRHSQNCTIIPIPAPGLADLVEEGKGDSPEAEALLRPLLEPYALDALVLGCTHYPFAQAAIRKILDIPLLDGGEGTARETRRQLVRRGLITEGAGSVLWDSSSGCNEALCRQLLAALI